VPRSRLLRISRCSGIILQTAEKMKGKHLGNFCADVGSPRRARYPCYCKIGSAKVHDGGHLDSRAHGLETSSVISRFLQVAPHPPSPLVIRSYHVACLEYPRMRSPVGKRQPSRGEVSDRNLKPSSLAAERSRGTFTYTVHVRMQLTTR
jgi:hypothetical protein